MNVGSVPTPLRGPGVHPAVAGLGHRGVSQSGALWRSLTISRDFQGLIQGRQVAAFGEWRRDMGNR
jgi:hypothetical protein